MASSSLMSIEKLNGRDNWASWSFAIKAYLQHEDFYDCILKEPLSTDSKSVKQDIKAKSKLILLVDPLLYVHIQDATTAKQVWESISKAFEDSGLCRKVGLLKELINTNLENSSSVEEFSLENEKRREEKRREEKRREEKRREEDRRIRQAKKVSDEDWRRRQAKMIGEEDRRRIVCKLYLTLKT